MAEEIKRLLGEGLLQHKIAARFGINQGRVSEIKTGKRFRDGRPGKLQPPGGSPPQLPF